MPAAIRVNPARAKSAVLRLVRRAGGRAFGAWMSLAAMVVLLGHGLIHPVHDESGGQGCCSNATCVHESPVDRSPDHHSCGHSGFGCLHGAGSDSGEWAEALVATPPGEPRIGGPAFSPDVAAQGSPCPLCFLLHHGGWQKPLGDSSTSVARVTEEDAKASDISLPARRSFGSVCPRGPPSTILL